MAGRRIGRDGTVSREVERLVRVRAIDALEALAPVGRRAAAVRSQIAVRVEVQGYDGVALLSTRGSGPVRRVRVDDQRPRGVRLHKRMQAFKSAIRYHPL